MLITIDAITRHHIIGLILDSDTQSLLFECLCRSGEKVPVFRDSCHLAVSEKGTHFTWRHGILSPLDFLHIIGTDGHVIPLPTKLNFFAQSQRIIFHLYQKGMNVGEIGALTQPLFRPPIHDVTYIDYKSTADLKVSNERLLRMENEIFAEVSLLADQFFADASQNFDLIYTAHVLEHPPSPFFFLRKTLSCVKSGGYVVSVVPSKRHTFDKKRRVTSLAEALGYFMLDLKKPSPVQVIDFCMHEFSEVDISSHSDDNYYNAIRHAYDVALRCMNVYVDCHSSVYDSKTFINQLLVFIKLELLNVELILIDDSEFMPDFTFVVKKSSASERFSRSLKVARDFFEKS